MKVDPKIRFQKQTFQKKLDQARSYKRSAKKLPDQPWEVFLAKIGLGSVALRLSLLAFLALIIIFVYAPNPFIIKNISYVGINTLDQQALSEEIDNYLSAPKFLPQKNLFLLSKKNLAGFILGRENILKVNSIEKKLPNTLIISLTPRLKTYLLKTTGNYYLISNDGKVTEKLTPEAVFATSSSYSSLAQIQTTGETIELSIGEYFFPEHYLTAISEIQRKLPEICGSSIKSFIIGSKGNSDIKADLAGGYFIYFDLKSDLAAWWPKLSTLLASINDQDKAKLYYIDLRLPNRAYVCYKGTACVKQENLVSPAADNTVSTSTPIIP